ncbi:hypothetical protein ACJX0J_014281, partial [Zea mays]
LDLLILTTTSMHSTCIYHLILIADTCLPYCGFVAIPCAILSEMHGPLMGSKALFILLIYKLLILPLYLHISHLVIFIYLASLQILTGNSLDKVICFVKE